MLQEAKAIFIEAPGARSSLTLKDITLPALNVDEVLIAVAASGVNRPDLLQRQGLYPPPKGVTEVPGLEVAGTVVKVGRNVRRWQAGDRVMALVPGGGYASRAIAHEGSCLPWPDRLSPGEAACLPEILFTSWFNLMHHGRLKEGESVLIHAGAGGVGHMAIQLAKAFGARPFATVGSDAKKAFCEGLGAEKAYNYNTIDPFVALKGMFGDKGVDVVLDSLGGDNTQRHLDLAGKGGRIVQIAFMNGPMVEIDLKPIMFKELVLTGSTLRRQPIELKARLAREIEESVLPLITRGEIKVALHQSFPAAQVQAAHDLLQSRDVMGKIALEW